jgi:fatty-acyl-CoA synthase
MVWAISGWPAGAGADHRGGHNIDPKLIEDALSKHPAVAMAAAVSSPTPMRARSCRLCAAKPGVAVSDQELMDFAAAHVPERAAIPKLVKIMPSLPVTGIGKIFAGPSATRDRGRCSRRGAECGRNHRRPGIRTQPRLGQVVRVRSDKGTEDLRATLERYAFKFEVQD